MVPCSQRGFDPSGAGPVACVFLSSTSLCTLGQRDVKSCCRNRRLSHFSSLARRSLRTSPRPFRSPGRVLSFALSPSFCAQSRLAGRRIVFLRLLCPSAMLEPPRPPAAVQLSRPLSLLHLGGLSETSLQFLAVSLIRSLQRQDPSAVRCACAPESDAITPPAEKASRREKALACRGGAGEMFAGNIPHLRLPNIVDCMRVLRPAVFVSTSATKGFFSPRYETCSTLQAGMQHRAP